MSNLARHFTEAYIMRLEQIKNRTAEEIACAIEDGIYAISNGQSESELTRSIRDQAAQIARGKK